jgi:exodeoxyribonuclease VII small subunit
MAKDAKVGTDKYSDVVGRLQKVVEELEHGELSLEDSLEKFSEGVRLVKRGEQLLGEAEKRVEQLLSDDGKTAPLDVDAAPSANRSAGRQSAAPQKRPEPPPDDFGPPPPGADEDVPF